MKISNVKRYAMSMVFILVSILFADNAVAQSNVASKELIGVWLMESMQYDGENKILCGTSQGKKKTVNVAPNYVQIKVYRANGEYACAEIVKLNDGKYKVLPHEYGTYSFKNGKYIEMGRNGNLKLINATTFTGRWKNRNDVWKKNNNIPAKLVNHVVDKCKAHQPESVDMQKLIKKYVFE